MNKFLIFLIVLISSTYLFFNLGKILDVSQKVNKADLIVSLGGGEGSRLSRAIELYEKDYSLKNLLILTGGTKASKLNQIYDPRVNHLKKNKKYIQFVYNPNTKNTLEEIIYINEYMNEHKLSSVIIVSDPYHMLRIKILTQLVNFENKKIYLVKSNPNWWNENRFYENEKSLKSVLLETIKIPYNILKFIIL